MLDEANRFLEAEQTLESFVEKGLATKKEVDGETKYFPIPFYQGIRQAHCRMYGEDVSYCTQLSNILNTPMMCGSPDCEDIATEVSILYEPTCQFRECVLYKDLKNHQQEILSKMLPVF